MNKIDIVIPYYDDTDLEWKKVLKKYMAEENSNDRQVIGDERYRDWECFKYWFRCIEKNCKWVNKVFLIVASETQIPKWVNINNPKLRIVLHEEYIPKELLPTFNTMTIELFISRIKDLSDNYVYCNDDYYFLNKTTAGMFFVDNYPVYKDTETELIKYNEECLNGSDGTFYSALNNGMDLQLKISGNKAKWYEIDHLPVSHKKDFEKQIIDEYFETFKEANSYSSFRNKHNYGNHLFTCLYKDLKPYYKFNNYNNSNYVAITKEINFDDYKDNDMVCFNDTEQLDINNFEEVKNKMIKFFKNKFPKKSKYEI